MRTHWIKQPWTSYSQSHGRCVCTGGWFEAEWNLSPNRPTDQEPGFRVRMIVDPDPDPNLKKKNGPGSDQIGKPELALEKNWNHRKPTRIQPKFKQTLKEKFFNLDIQIGSHLSRIRIRIQLLGYEFGSHLSRIRIRIRLFRIRIRIPSF